MRILIACEFSGIVREAFRRAGHDAWSCDFLETEIPGPHLQCDVATVLNDDWQMMIAHPTCTYLCSSGIHWNKRVPGRQQLTELALDFIRLLLGSKIHRICLENPVGVISTRIRKPSQIIQPWQFGHPESKATCLWLKNLPPLKPTMVLKKDGRWHNQTASGQNKLAPSEDRWKIRSRTYPGIAAAMAQQWGGFN